MAILRRRTAKKRRTRVSTEDLFSMIRDKAYDIYEKRGYSHGDDWSDWFEAERQVKSELRLR